MKGLDTNILVRFLVNDDAAQAQTVRALFHQTQKKNERLFVSQFTVLETIWVLGARYGYSRENILMGMQKLSALPVLNFESPEILEELSVLATDTPIEITDLLIGISAKLSHCETTWTFDRKASQGSKLFKLLS